jgi:hypothetical protein
MKKIILFLLLWIPIMVKAETFYTNYEFNGENNQLVEESELLERKEEVRYQNICNKIINEGYYPIMQNPINAPIINSNDVKMIDAYSSTYLVNSDGAVTTLLNQNYQSGRYLMFRYFASKNISNISKIVLYYKGELIDFKLVDGNFKYNENLNADSYFILDLLNNYEYQYLSIKISFNSINNNDINYYIRLFKNYYLNSNDYLQYYILFPRIKLSEDQTINFMDKENFNNLISKFSWLSKNSYSSIYNISYYVYKVKAYKYYNKEEVYTDNYTIKALDNCKLNYQNFQTYYQYYKRDKIELLDEITSENQNYLLSSTIPNEKLFIEDNLNLKANGEYLIKISYKDNLFYHKIKVNIKADKKDIKIANEQIKLPEATTNKISKSFVKRKTISTTTTILKRPLTTKVLTSKANTSKLVISKRTQHIDILYFLIGNFIIMSTIYIFKHKKKN